MSRQYNTDGIMGFPPDNGEPITLNAFESIECAIAFDVRCWSEERRSAWVNAIVFGVDEDSWWDNVAKRFGWDEEDRKRANMMHEQWVKAKETQPKTIVNKWHKNPLGDYSRLHCPWCDRELDMQSAKEYVACPYCGKAVKLE